MPVPAHLIPPDDEERAAGLDKLGVLDSEREQRFDALVAELASKLDVPIAYLALIARDRQWIKSKVGPIPTEAPREHAFCSHTILGDEPVLVADATKDARFAGSPLVKADPNLRFYAGVPISDGKGHNVGTVCVAGPTPREITPRDLAILEGFAERLEEELNSPAKIFLAYASEDEELIGRLIAADSRLEDPAVMELWSSRRIGESNNGHWKLKDALWRAQAAVLMVSPAFLRSDFVTQGTLKQLLLARELESFTTRVTLLEPCDHSSVDWLASRPPWPSNNQAIAIGSPEETDRLLRELAIDLLGAPPVVEEATEAALQATQEVQVFLSHAGEDGPAVKDLAGRLRQAGLGVWLDVDELQPGDDWMQALEDALDGSDAFAVYIGRSGVARWIGREVRVALDRNAKDPRYRFIPILGPGAEPESLPRFVKQHHWLDLREGDPQPAEIRKLVASILSRPAEAVSLLPPGEPPFRGLLTFGFEHAHLFFGRDQETSELLGRVQESPFLAVIGDSGSGKSSLVRAGLIPALHRGHFQDGSGTSPTWQVATIKPGSNPFRELANGLLDLLPEASPAEKMTTRDACVKQLGRGTQGLCSALAALVPKGERTLLVIDQFEEVFTQSSDPDERDRFIDTLLEASNCEGERPLHTIVTLRADFYSHCFEHPKLPAVMSTNQYAVRAIAADKLPEVIEKPALLAGIQLEAGLVEAILFDLGEGPGNLPLLEHTLLQLWEMRSGETLTHASYEEMGRVQGALEHHAEKVYEQFDDEQKKLARKLLLGLVVPTENAGPARRRARIGELLPASEGRAAAEAVLERLVEERLLMVRAVSTGGDARGGEEAPRAQDDNEVEDTPEEALRRGRQRLQARVSELLPAGKDRAAAEALLERLVEERLLIVRGVSAAGAARGGGQAVRGQDDNEIEVTHEALLRGWQRLRRWLEEDREFLFWRQRTHANFTAWKESEHDSGALLRGGPLSEAQRWLASRAEDLSEEGRVFIQKSIDLAVRQKRIRGAVMATIAIIGAVALVLAWVATRARNEAEQSLLLATTAVDEMLTKVGSEALQDVPQLEEVRQELLERARALYQQLGEQGGGTAELRLKTAAAPALMAKIDRQLGAVAEARAGLESAIEALEKLVREDPGNPQYRLELSRTHNELGWLITDQIGKGLPGDPVAAAEHLDRAVEFQEALLAAEPGNAEIAYELARSHLNRGNLRSLQEELEGAEQDYRAAMDRVQPFAAEPGEFEYDIRQQLARSHNDLANLYQKQKKRDEATAQYDRAAELLGSLVDDRPKSREYQTELAMTHGNLALHLRRRDPRAAQEHSGRAIALFDDLTDALPDIRSQWAIAHRTQGLALIEAGRVEEAGDSLGRASMIFGELLSDHPDRHDDRMSEAVTLIYLGVLRAERGESAELARIRDRLLDTLAKLPPESREWIQGHPHYAIVEGGA